MFPCVIFAWPGSIVPVTKVDFYWPVVFGGVISHPSLTFLDKAKTWHRFTLVFRELAHPNDLVAEQTLCQWRRHNFTQHAGDQVLKRKDAIRTANLRYKNTYECQCTDA